jgi:hypothetical protein
MRAALYYDSDNTAYFTDPASTSTLNVLNLTGRLGIDNPADYSSSAITSLTSAPIDSYAQYDPNAGSGFFSQYYPMIHQTALHSGGYRTHTSYGLIKSTSGYTSSGHYFAVGGNDTYPTESFFMWYGGIIAHTNGYVITNGSSRSPLFYDSDNTSFYTDPASTSVLNNVQVTTFGVGTAASGTTGEIRATNNVTAYYSDERLKENITTISSALSKLLTLRGVTFNSNEIAEQYGYTDKKEQVGVIAQDVEKVLPQVVVPAPFDIAQDEDGNEYSKSGENYKTVHYDKLVPLLIEAIKELKGEIEELKSKIPA